MIFLTVFRVLRMHIPALCALLDDYCAFDLFLQ